MSTALLFFLLVAGASARFWATSPDENRRALHWAPDAQRGFASQPLQYDPRTDGCGVRVYIDEAYRFSAQHIRYVFALVNRTYVAQGLPQVWIHEILRERVAYTGSDGNVLHRHLSQISKTDSVCAVMWLMGRRLDGGVIGYGYVGGACNQCGAPVVAFAASERVIDEDDGFLTAVNLEAWIVAHELGHLLGADHVGTSHYIMSPTIPNRNPSVEPFAMHPTTKSRIEAYLAGCNDPHCLTSPASAPPSTQINLNDLPSHTHGTSHDAYWALFALILPFSLLWILVWLYF